MHDAAVNRRELIQIGLGALLVAAAGAAHYLDATPVLAFAVAAAAIAMLAHLVGSATGAARRAHRVVDGGRRAVGAREPAGALHRALRAQAGLIGVVQAALVGSVIANGVLVLGLAFLVGGLRNGRQTFDSPRGRMIATLTVLAAAILSMPTLAHTFHTPAEAHGRTLSFICAGVLIVLFFVTLPSFLRGDDGAHEEPLAGRWP